MSFILKRSVFAHYFLNPPTEDISCDICIKLINPCGAITLDKAEAGIQTRYLLTVSDPSTIGLRSNDQEAVERTIRDLVLSFNLGLTKACLSTLQGGLSSADVQSQPSKTVEQTLSTENITIVEKVLARETVRITIGICDEVDEKQALERLEKIVQVNRFGLQSTSALKLVNLAKALNEYESAMLTFDRLRIFKNLFNTLELCANWNGGNRTGSVLDSLISSISNVQKTDVEYWRLFYNRTKHVDRTPVDTSQFVQGMERLSSILPSIREAAKRLIIDRLNQI